MIKIIKMIGLETQTGNYLVTNGTKCAYVTKDLLLLREAKWNEFVWLFGELNKDTYFVADKISYNDFLNFLRKGLVQFEDDKVLETLPEGFSVTILKTEKIAEDFSGYEESKCNNGGSYGFWTNRHHCKLTKTSGQVLFGWYDTQHATAEIHCCPACGQFDDHGYQKAEIKKGEEIIGFTNEDYPCRTEIFIY